LSDLSKEKGEVKANLAEIFSWQLATLLLNTCSAENPPFKRNLKLKHAQTDAILKNSI
jgi:hypothetical protein